MKKINVILIIAILLLGFVIRPQYEGLKAYSCPTATPAYFLNGTNCERYLTATINLAGGDTGPTDLFVDSSDNVYTSNGSSNTVTFIPPGGPAESYPISIGSINPASIFVDASGNMYTANFDSNDVTFIPVGGVGAVSYPLGIGDDGPISIFVDGSGNIYTANYFSSTVTFITAGGGSSTSYALSAGGLNPRSIYVNGTGDMYTANSGSNDISFITAGGGSAVSYALPTGAELPKSVTLDGSGNIFVSNENTNNITKFDPDGTNPVNTALPAGSSVPDKLIIDGSGNIFVLNELSDNVSKILAGGAGSYNIPLGAPAGTFNISGLGIDSLGNLYVSNNLTDNITYLEPDIIAANSQTFTTSVDAYTNQSNVFFGQNVRLEANVITEDLGIATGNVTFFDGVTSLSTEALNGSAYAFLDTTSLAVGTHSITARYNGDGDYFSSTSPAFNVVIKAPATTTTTVSSNHNPALLADAVTFTATVEHSEGIANLGDVTFYDGVTSLGNFTVNSFGQAFLTTSLLTLGNHNITAEYSGNVSFNASTSDVFVQNISATLNTSVNIQPNNNPTLVGQEVVFTILVTSPGGYATGDVDLYDGSTLLQTITLNSFGQATYSISSLPRGVHIISADYLGSGSFNSSNTSINMYVLGEGDQSITDLGVTIIGEDDGTSLQTIQVGNNIDWIIKYQNYGPQVVGSNIFFPVREHQVFVIGSIQTPPGWEVSYSRSNDCENAVFDYTPTVGSGSPDANIGCVKFFTEAINIPSTSSTSLPLQGSSSTGSINVGTLGGTDVYKVYGYKNKIYFFNHHTGASPLDATPAKNFFCYDLLTGTNCVSANPGLTYPISLGVDGTNNKAQMATSNIATAVILANKMYFPFTSELGHGIMCLNLDSDEYCNDPGLNSRGQVILTTDAAGAFGKGNAFDIGYNPNLKELYSLSMLTSNQMLHITCFSLLTNTPCGGQPYDTNVFAYDPDRAHLLVLGNRVYAHTYFRNSPPNDGIGCVDMITRNLCTNFATPKIVSANAANPTMFELNGSLCAYATDKIDNLGPDETGLYCYDVNANTFIKKMSLTSPGFASIPDTMSFKDQNYPGRLYVNSVFYENPKIFCVNTDTMQECPGWEGGINAPNDDPRTYSLSYLDNCLWGATDLGQVYPIDPITGGACSAIYSSPEGLATVSLDSTNYYCNSSGDNAFWDKVQVDDFASLPVATRLNVSVYDSSQCTTVSGLTSCTGTPLKTGNLLSNSTHSLTLFDISYTQHKRLTAVLDFEYSSLPNPTPRLSIQLNRINLPEICLTTQLFASADICTNPITQVCGSTIIENPNEDDLNNDNNTDEACLSVLPYFGKGGSNLTSVASTSSAFFCPTPGPNPGSYPGSYPGSGNGTGSGNGNGFINNLNPIENIQNAVNEFNLNPSLPLLINIILLVGGLLLLISTIVSSLAGSSLNIVQLLGVLAGFLFPNKKKYWGIIFDAEKNTPIPFAVINLIKIEGNVLTIVNTTISDVDGRYRLNLEQKDNYKIEIKAPGYLPTNKNLNINYFFSGKGEIVADIPMQRIGSEVNLFKVLMHYNKRLFLSAFALMSMVLALVGLSFTTISILQSFNIWLLLLLVLYIVIFVVNFLPVISKMTSAVGVVSDSDLQNIKISGAAVRIYNQNRQLQIALTNSQGIVRFNLQPGYYHVLATKSGYSMIQEDTQTQLGLLPRTVRSDGYLDKNILMKRMSNTTTDSFLDNPFS